MKKPTKKDIKFTAILAKNQIARIFAHKLIWSPYREQILECLKDIEKVTGEGNQPSVQNIIDNPTV